MRSPSPLYSASHEQELHERRLRDENRRYEVELQLGKCDESHIIRTIEYWDIERKRYPQYEHTAVLVAEDITSRFLNVVALFNGFIPLVAIQMNAFRIENGISLVFTKVLDQMQLGLVDDDEDTQETTDRAYWESRGSPETVKLVDELLELVNACDRSISLKYNKFYVGLARDGRPCNFVTFRPKKHWVRVEPRLPRSDATQARLEDEGLDLMEYDSHWGRYRINLRRGDLEKHREFLGELIHAAHADSLGG